jgi:Insertion element 4 transposase N-terminal
MSTSLLGVIGIGTLTRLVPRELADEVVSSAGRTEGRRNELPARVMVYFVMAMALFLRRLLLRGNAQAAQRSGLYGHAAARMGNAHSGRPVPRPQRLGAKRGREGLEAVAPPRGRDEIRTGARERPSKSHTQTAAGARGHGSRRSVLHGIPKTRANPLEARYHAGIMYT